MKRGMKTVNFSDVPTEELISLREVYKCLTSVDECELKKIVKNRENLDAVTATVTNRSQHTRTVARPDHAAGLGVTRTKSLGSSSLTPRHATLYVRFSRSLVCRVFRRVSNLHVPRRDASPPLPEE